MPSAYDDDMLLWLSLKREVALRGATELASPPFYTLLRAAMVPPLSNAAQKY